MAFTGNYMCTSFKQELMTATHNFNDSAAGDPTVAVLDFGSDKTSTTGTFTIQFPVADAANAIIRIA